MQDLALDELDLRLVNALQIDPRASWARLGSVLEVDPVTLARRWERLHTERLAWVTGLPLMGSAGRIAIVEIETRPGRLIELAETLGYDPEAITIDITSGPRDLVILAGAGSYEDLYRYILERLRSFDFITGVQTNLVAQGTDASRWRLRALDPGLVKALTDHKESTARPRRVNRIDSLVAAELQHDGRASASDIANRLGLKPRRVSESITALLTSGRVTLRAEIVRSQSSWPFHAWYFLTAPAAQSAKIAGQLARMPEIRAVFSVVGRYNIAIAVWTRTLEDVSKLEALIERQVPSVRFSDRAVVMRTIKLAGNRLDEQGRRTGYIAPPPERS